VVYLRLKVLYQKEMDILANVVDVLQTIVITLLIFKVLKDGKAD
jgi:hypothetical protein